MNESVFLKKMIMLALCASGSLSVAAQEVTADADTMAIEIYTGDEDDMLLPEERAALNAPVINAAIAGKWKYDKPSVQAKGTSVLGKLGKPIAKSKAKKKLDKAFKKLKIKKRWNSLTLTPEGQWTLDVVGVTMSGYYTYDPTTERLTLKWHGVPLHSVARRDGKRLHLLLDTDHLLNLMRIISGFSHSETLKALAFLSENFDDVMVGFELKQ